MTGYKHTKEQHKKIGLANKGKPNFFKGKKRPKQFSDKLSESRKGKLNPNWKGGISPKIRLLRKGREYKLWRKSVFERDKWTCIWCGYKGKNIHADHIKRFSDYPELRFAIDNGRTLCVECHKKTDTYGNKK
jgi:hypothetical protein